MKRTGLLFLALLTLLVSCAPRVWYKPGATSSERDRDLEVCRYQAQARFAEAVPPLAAFRVYVDVPFGTPYELERRVEEAADDAVRDAYEDYRDTFIRGFVTDCMEAKGYVLVEER
ncbi:hypothetical protein [Oceanithermus sp.]|uniref:hypothetical protein n=1 Tax=Oceanithermus sp. TaxID=2268145 RepID=UPI00257D4479|nr:hypothetical protein [Oceanithermus sp.]